jgi:hypothetical protein
MNSLSPIQKLDVVLKFLSNDRGYADISYIIKGLTKKEELKNEFPGDDTIRVLDKLIKDGFVQYEDRPTSRTALFTNDPELIRVYWISFDGKVFNEEDGYKRKQKNDRIELLYKNATTFALIFGGVAAGVYYTVEILKMIFC